MQIPQEDYWHKVARKVIESYGGKTPEQETVHDLARRIGEACDDVHKEISKQVEDKMNQFPTIPSQSIVP